MKKHSFGVEYPDTTILRATKPYTPSVTDVLDSVMHEATTPTTLESKTVASAIPDIGMLRWLDDKPDADLR